MPRAVTRVLPTVLTQNQYKHQVNKNDEINMEGDEMYMVIMVMNDNLVCKVSAPSLHLKILKWSGLW